MRVGIKCPYCKEQFIDTVCTPWFVRGFVLIVRCGRKTLIGCRRCVSEKVMENFFSCLLLGWWGIPHGVLFTPFVLIQNLLIALFPGGEAKQRKRMIQTLDNLGISPTDVEVGDDGLIASQRVLIEHLIAVLQESIQADLPVGPEKNHATQPLF